MKYMIKSSLKILLQLHLALCHCFQYSRLIDGKSLDQDKRITDNNIDGDINSDISKEVR